MTFPVWYSRRMNKQLLTLILIISLITNAYFIFTNTQKASEQEQEPIAEEAPEVAQEFESGASYPFIRVVDGDTVVVGVDGTTEFVRLIGIDSPEPNDPGGPECFAAEATDHMVELARTGTVVLHFDESQGSRDKYSRLLAYAELPDGTDLGEAMLRDGYAREFTYDRPYERRDSYREAEKEATSLEAGLWSPTTCIAE